MAGPHPALLALAMARTVSRVESPDDLVRSAVEHGMAGLLWAEVEAGRIDVSQDHQRSLARLALTTRARHRSLWQALERVTAVLAKNDIAVASAKGVTAEIRWYERLGDRPCIDLDIMLDPRQVVRASEALETLQPDHPLLGSIDELATKGDLQSVDVRVDGFDIDLHFDILKLGVPLRHNHLIWDRAVELQSPDGGIVRALDAETSFVLFLLHLLKDRFAYLLGFVDVARLIDRADLDWRFVSNYLDSEGLTAPALHALDIVCDTLGIATPLPQRPGGWRGATARTLWPASMSLKGSVGRVTHHRRQFLLPFLIKGQESAGARALFKLAIPPASLIDYYYPDVGGSPLRRLVVGRVKRAQERHDQVGVLRDSQGDAAPQTSEQEAGREVATRGYKRIPPRSGHVLVPTTSRPAAGAAIAMYSASRSRALVLQRVAFHAVRLVGPRVLPGRSTHWAAPADWAKIAGELLSVLGPFDDAVIYERPQRDRAGFALLVLRNGLPTAFVKLQPDGDSLLAREAAALEAMQRFGPRSFTVPDVVAVGAAGSWRYLAVEPFPQALHRPPAAPALETIAAHIREGLEGLPRDAAIPDHWTPIHGDFTPWNLRQFSDGRLLLIDWENTAWGPPGADVVLYRASAVALGVDAGPIGRYPEAVSFWRHRLDTDSATHRDERLRTAVLRELATV